MKAQVFRQVGLLVIGLILAPLSSDAQSGPPAIPPLPILNFWQFNDTNWFSGFGYEPISHTNVDQVMDWEGNSLLLDSTNMAFLKYNVIESDGHTNFLCDSGTVRFWFSPSWTSTNQGGTGPGTWGRFVELGNYTTNATEGWWSLYVNPSGTEISFSGQTNGMGTTYLTAPISWIANTWHMVGLSYCATNSTLYVDDQFTTNGTGVLYYPGTNVFTNGLCIGSDNTGLAQAKGQFDSFRTYNTAYGAAFFTNAYAAIRARIDLWEAFQDGEIPGGNPSANSITLEHGALTCVTNVPVFLTNVVCSYVTNQAWTFYFDIAGGSNGVPYTVFLTTNLIASNITNSQWVALGQGLTCNNYSVTNQPTNCCFYVLGSPLDSDDDSLTDAYEILVSKTDPNNPDTDGDGLTDGCEVVTTQTDPNSVDTGSTGTPDDGKDPDNDGWSNLDEFNLGTNPNVFNTPLSPINFIATTSTNQTTLSWKASTGPVLSYTISIDTGSGFTTLTNVTAPQTSAQVSKAFVNTATYRIVANYAGGSSIPGTTSISVFTSNANSPAAIIRGPLGNLYVAVASMATNVDYYRVYSPEVISTDYPLDEMLYFPTYLEDSQSFTPTVSLSTFTNIPIAAFTNGVARLPHAIAPAYAKLSFDFSLAHTSAGKFGEFASPNQLYQAAIPFINGTEHMKQNAAFLLRAADSETPFHFGYSFYPYKQYTMAQDYVVSGLYDLNWDTDCAEYAENELLPFQDNYFFRNFLFDPAAITSSGNLGNGIHYSGGIAFSNTPGALMFPTYNFVTNGGGSIPTVLSISNSQYIYYGHIDEIDAGTNAIGLYAVSSTSSNTTISLDTNARNIYGLRILSVLCPIATNPATFATLYPGNTLVVPSIGQGYYYFETEQPALQTVDYFFNESYFYAYPYRPYHPCTDLWPGTGPFKITNSSPFMAATIRTPIVVNAWAKQSITNGASNKFVYVQQYFDKAFLADIGGNITTNETGVLSEYGDFYPTDAGKTFLVTKPDSTGRRGTNVIYVVGLAVDANRDAIIDGKDATTPGNPYVFWNNNDVDRYHTVDLFDADEDDLPTKSMVLDSQFIGSTTGKHEIPSKRDLEDYARIWAPGVAALASNLPPGCTLEFAWSYPQTSNAPSINLFQAVETNGGTLYLNDDSVAGMQTNASLAPFYGTVSPFTNVVLTTNGHAIPSEHYIFCGSKRGSGTLLLIIHYPGGGFNILGSVDIRIRDVNEMYERWTIGDGNGRIVPLQLVTANLPAGVSQPFQYGYDPQSNTNIPYIVFVHGWNMGEGDKDVFGGTAFKRLWWQGYDGRFGAFRWPTRYFKHFWDALDLSNYNDSEFLAWKSGQPLESFVSQLNSQYPNNVYVMAHSMGNVVAGEALRLAGTNQIANTYVAAQAAIPAHCYDNAVTNMPFSGFLDNETPNCYAFYYTNGAPSYFSSTAGAATYVNFFNMQDYALDKWVINQEFKPLPLSGYNFTTLFLSLHPSGFYKQFGAGTNDFRNLSFPDDTYEIFAHCDEARSFALGAQVGVGGVFSDSEVDLHAAPYDYGDAHKYHSGQFRSTIMARGTYWDQLLQSFRLKEAQ